MRIERAHLHGIGVFDDLQLELPRGTDPTKADVYLFTGPNGCGKSTLLYALAAAVGGLRLTDPSLLQRRMNAAGAFVEVAEGLEAAAVARTTGSVWQSRLVAGAELSFLHPADGLRRFARPEGPFTWSEADRRALTSAAFAYSGRPSLDAFRVDAIREPGDSPLNVALGFHQTAQTALLAQWLANTKAKAALAAEEKRGEQAEVYRESVRRIERAISEVMGEELTFQFSYEPKIAIRIVQRGQPVDPDLLADGAKSVISWLADLLMRLERITWSNALLITEREFILFLDEAEIYLHPNLQRRLIPSLQTLFPNAQIIATTHSPFVVASATDAWVYELERDGASAHLRSQKPLRGGASYASIVRSVFGIEEEFDPGTEAELTEFYALRQDVLGGKRDYAALLERGESLATRGPEVADIVHRELRQVERKLGRTPAA